MRAAVALEREAMAILAESVLITDPEDMSRQVDALCRLGEGADACALVNRYLEQAPHADAATYSAPVAEAAWSALAAARAAGELEETQHRAHALTAAALAATLAGEPAVGEWRCAASSASRYGADDALRSHLALAGALLAAGERDEGRSLLVETWQSARDMGAHGRRDEAAAMARRHRVQLPDQPVADRRLAALTPREREVLDVLATGATNRAIAQRLFISEKTVSVHVTNLLAKLGAGNRGEAAAIARDLAR